MVVPDEQTWCAAGTELSSLGVRPVFEAAAVQRLLLPDQLPAVLDDAVEALREHLDTDVDVVVRPLRLPEQTAGHHNYSGASEPHHDDGRQEHGSHEEGGHEHSGHQDMMAIVGEPSADGLVMERIDLRYGPLGAAIPGGLVVDATLDGDVVEHATVKAVLVADVPLAREAAPPDALAPVAWRSASAATAAAAETDGWQRVAALELERAGSHISWLRSFARLLGWATLVRRADEASSSVTAARDELANDAVRTLPMAVRALAPISELVLGSVWMSIRTRGRGVLSAAAARERGLRGPIARASGVDDDARDGNAAYGALGFRTLTETDGDAYARIRLRVREAAQSLELAGAAVETAGSRRDFPAWGAWVEGPRGPIRAEWVGGGWRPRAQGVAEARSAAAAAMTGLEWSTALAVLASFDLSPWQIEP